MDMSEEIIASRKRIFKDFLYQEASRSLGKKGVRNELYYTNLYHLIRNKRHRLIIDMSDLSKYSLDLARRVVHNPGEYIQPFSEALTEITRKMDPKYLKEGDQMFVGFEWPFGFHRVTPSDHLSEFIGTMICVEGIVTKCSLVKKVKSQFMSREHRGSTSNMGLPTGSVYPTLDNNGKLLVTEYGLCKYKGHQTLSMQVRKNSAPGQILRTIDVILGDELVNSCKPGDRVAIVGTYKVRPGKSKGSIDVAFRTVLIANNVSLLEEEANAPVYTAEDVNNIRKIAERDDAFDLLSNSLAPSIYGHSWIKKAVILLMLGGMENKLNDGTHLRGDINMMMVGDSSVLKSQLLKAIMNIASLAISTTGRGSSGVGLTASLTSDQKTGERRLEAGAMVLADRGVVYIDEFNKMNDSDRVAIHEVMEQQTVTIANAGIHASLNARCGVVAVANPIYGSYDRSSTLAKNVGLPNSLLSKFDFLFVLLDQMDPDMDCEISEHVLRMHQFHSALDERGVAVADENSRFVEEEDAADAGSSVFIKYNWMVHGAKGKKGQRVETLAIKFLKKYIHYAKSRMQPKLTKEVFDHIATAYAELKNAGTNAKSGRGWLPLTARTLETIMRVSSAHAKLKLNNKVSKTDVEAALKFLNFAIYHKELTEIEKHKEEREKDRKGGKKRKSDQDSHTSNENGPACGLTRGHMQSNDSLVVPPQSDNSTNGMILGFAREARGSQSLEVLFDCRN